jgi:hypothetical protein
VAFDSTIVLDDFSGDDISFVEVKPDKRGGSLRKDNALTAPAYCTLHINHAEQGSGQTLADATLVSVIERKYDVDQVPDDLQINVTIRRGRRGQITVTQIKDRFAEISDLLLTSGNIEKLLLGEI